MWGASRDYWYVGQHRGVGRPTSTLCDTIQLADSPDAVRGEERNWATFKKLSSVCGGMTTTAWGPETPVSSALQCRLTPVTLWWVAMPSVPEQRCTLGSSCSVASSFLVWQQLDPLTMKHTSGYYGCSCLGLCKPVLLILSSERPLTKTVMKFIESFLVVIWNFPFNIFWTLPPGGH